MPLRFRSTLPALILLFALLPGLPSCRKTDGIQGSPGAVAGGDWLVRYLPSDPTTLNPVTATDAYESLVNGFVYESLLERDNRTLELKPLLAEKWEVSPDHLQYTFTLREGVRWQDGKPLTAEDVIFTFQKVKDPTVDAPHLRSYFKDLEKVEVLERRRIRFTYAMPYFKALEMIGGMSIIPQHVFSQGDFNAQPAGRSPLGTGPFRFARWDTGKEIDLDRNEEYWGEKPRLSRMVFKIINDDTVALQVLKKKEMDFMTLTPVQWEKQTGEPEFAEVFSKLRYPNLNFSYIGWNIRSPLFSDRRVRTAMTLLLDRETILQKIRYGLGKVVSGNFFFGSPEYDKSIAPWPYDPSRAAELLKEAGWEDHDGDGLRDKGGVPFKFEFLFSSGSTFAEQLATVLKEALSREGIEVSIRQLEWSTFIKVVDDRRFDAVTLSWSLPVEDDPYQVWHSSQAEKGSNFIGFVNPEADRIIEEARTTFDREKRIRLFHRFHRILHEEQPYTFLFVTDSLVALDKRFQGVTVYPLGLDPREWHVPEEAVRYK